MDLEYFVSQFSRETTLGNQVALYIIAPTNLAPSFQNRNLFRAGVAGSREAQNIDRSATASGADSKASSLHSRAAMYFGNWIAGGRLVAALVLPPSVINTPSGPLLTRVLERRREGDARPDYALRGKTVAVALEQIFHQNLDDMPRIRRARTNRVEWFSTSQPSLENAKMALQAVGQGIYYDFTKFPPRPSPSLLKGERLTGGQVLDTTTHSLRQSPRLAELTMREVVEEDGTVRLSLDDIEDIRANTTRGNELLELITRRTPVATTSSAVQTGPNVTTRSRRTQTAEEPVTVRLTRSKVRELREAASTPMGERRRRQLARALASLVQG